MSPEEPPFDFEAPAMLRKWPSLNNRRRGDREPYLVSEGTLESCIREFMAKPVATRELYDIRTERQPHVELIVDAHQVAELARLHHIL